MINRKKLLLYTGIIPLEKVEVRRLGRWDVEYGISHQCLKLIIEKDIINFIHFLQFVLRQITQAKTGINHVLKVFFNGHIVGQMKFDRPGNVGEITLAGVMEQASQLYPLRAAPAFGFR